MGIAFHSETNAGAAIPQNTVAYTLTIQDQTDDLKNITLAQGQFTRTDISTSNVYYVGKMTMDHSTTPSTYTFKKLANPFWLGNYDLSNY